MSATFSRPARHRRADGVLPERIFVGLFFLGWDWLTKRQHLAVTFLMAIGLNLAVALWILIANGWMQSDRRGVLARNHAHGDDQLRRSASNPVAQVVFVHTVAVGHVTASVFVMGISAWYILKRRDLAFARALCGRGRVRPSPVAVRDRAGRRKLAKTLGDVQRVKLAAIEGEWKTALLAAFTRCSASRARPSANACRGQNPGALGTDRGPAQLDLLIKGLSDLEKGKRELRPVRPDRPWGADQDPQRDNRRKWRAVRRPFRATRLLPAAQAVRRRSGAGHARADQGGCRLQHHPGAWPLAVPRWPALAL
ncbi:MAG: cytochrome ubiquinol oxidase subunit I [Rhodopseudomonas palustris]|nr:cytochrome ubiquinol oxidase subunit I [Rhodopseudomonas palustris]